MHINSVIQLPIPQEDWEFESSWAFQQEGDGILGLAWVGLIPGRSRISPTIDFLFLDARAGTILSQESYRYPGKEAGNLFLAAGRQANRWLLAWRVFPSEWAANSLMVGSFQLGAPFSTVPAIEVDQAEDTMTIIGPVLLLTETEQDVLLLYQRPEIEDVQPVEVRTAQIAGGYLAAAPRVTTIDWTVKARALAHRNAFYLLLMTAELEKEGKRVTGGDLTGAQSVWHGFVAPGRLTSPALLWKQRLPGGVPATDPYPESGREVRMAAQIIAGPSLPASGASSIIVGTSIVKTEHLSSSALLCLDEAGQVVQQRQDTLGEDVMLCLCGDTVVGVDQVKGRWRLWTWTPFAPMQESWRAIWLDDAVQHAYVVANDGGNEENNSQCWVIEEYPERIEITKREAHSLQEVDEALRLTELRLLHTHQGLAWNWSTRQELLSYKGMLILLGANEHGQVVFCQIA